ncbi:MAG TPA: anaerobic ribonucleoside-triphosphate reductase activating protein [Candidatus Moranbacteria bacterium]|nr:anaerobic ribonucleoside-triphosphate reductase activating protein [Candidatus Moranbacteria bacterium]
MKIDNCKLITALVIAGFQKLTLLDYPGHLAATVFTVGCSFRCPFCHNPELVNHGTYNIEHGTIEKDFFEFLKKRKGKLEGVCITGGEPTIQPDLVEFIGKIRKLGYKVKLDTNGTRPDILREVISERLVDFIAMDIKNQPKKYEKTINTKFDLNRIKLSIGLIMNSRIPYEFRTTAVPGIHSERDFLAIAKWIKNAQSYWLQRYQETKILDPNLKKKTKGKKLDLEKIKTKIEKNFGKIGIRG